MRLGLGRAESRAGPQVVLLTSPWGSSPWPLAALKLAELERFGPKPDLVAYGSALRGGRWQRPVSLLQRQRLRGLGLSMAAVTAALAWPLVGLLLEALGSLQLDTWARGKAAALLTWQQGLDLLVGVEAANAVMASTSWRRCYGLLGAFHRRRLQADDATWTSVATSLARGPRVDLTALVVRL